MSMLKKLILSVLLFATILRAEDKTISFDFPVPNPKDVTINAGDSVTWIGASGTHPLEQVTGNTSDVATTGGFTAASSPFTFKFDNAGTYYYRCTNHGVSSQGGAMRGSVTVLEAGQPTPVVTKAATNTPAESTCSTKPGLTLLLSPANESSTSKNKVSLDWEDNDCATSYTVLLRQDKKNGQIIEQKDTEESKHKTVKLVKGKKYFWFISACNSEGCKKSKPFSFSVK